MFFPKVTLCVRFHQKSKGAGWKCFGPIRSGERSNLGEAVRDIQVTEVGRDLKGRDRWSVQVFSCQGLGRELGRLEAVLLRSCKYSDGRFD